MRFILPLAVALVASSAAQAAVRVPVNQATRVPLRGQAADVIVGNPTIADVNVLDGRTVYLVGRSAGVTNLVVLDAAGRTIFSDTVVVGNVGGAGDTVTIARGRTVTDVSCAPTCADAPAAGGSGPAALPAMQVTGASTPSAAAVNAQAAESTAPAGASSVGSTTGTPR